VADSQVPNYESIPMKNKFKKNISIQNLGNGSVPKAAGYVINAKSIP